MQNYENKDPLANKINAVRKAMKGENLSGLIFYSSGQLSMLEVNPVLWISGVLPMGPNTGVVLGESGDPTLIISLTWDEGRVRQKSWIADLRIADGFIEQVGEVVSQKGIKGDIGIVGQAFMPAAIYQGLGGLSGVRLRSADALFGSLARLPDAGALPSLERAGQVADAGFQKLLDSARVGMSEHELAAEVEYAMRSMGAEDNFGMVTASEHNHCTHPPSDRKLKPGDIVIAEITPAWDGHFVQLCRTAVMGTPSALVRAKFAIVEEAMVKSLEAVRPGNKVGAVSQVMNQVFAHHGYAEYCRPPYIRVRGHGLGFWSMPFAEMVDENETVIEAGMDFVVHPNQYLPETGYLMLGDTVWVEKEGPRRLTQTPMKLFTVEV